MVKLIPTAKVIFKDGHVEESISVFPVFENVGTISTISGSYLYDHNNPVKKYHPEYDDVDCWIVDPSVENIVVNWGGQDE